MKHTLFTGAGVAIITPMRADGSVNLDKLREIINWQIENGTDAIIICGTTGESAALSHEEHLETIRAAVEYTAHRIPVIAGSGSNDTAYAAALSQDAESLGADGLLMVTPYYNKTSQAGLVAHFTYVADRVNIPIILYNVPSRTGLSFRPETYAALSAHPNICGIKEASGDFKAIAQTMALCGDQIDLYSGNDENIIPVLSLGGVGVISVLSNVFPRAAHNICAQWLSGDLVSARKLQLDLMPLIDALFCDVSPIPVKEAMNMMGLDVGPCRLPLVPLSEKNRETLRARLAEQKLL